MSKYVKSILITFTILTAELFWIHLPSSLLKSIEIILHNSTVFGNNIILVVDGKFLVYF
jgi:hypothetical protein